MTAIAERARPVTSISARRLCPLLGVSYRQLDYAVRSVAALRSLPTMSGGSGTRRRFGAETVLRLAVAARLAEAIPAGNSLTSGSQWVPAVQAVMDGRRPPRSGFALLTAAGRVRYFSKTLDLTDVAAGPVGTVIRYDIDLVEQFGLLAA
jgi:hypothetical protein